MLAQCRGCSVHACARASVCVCICACVCAHPCASARSGHPSCVAVRAQEGAASRKKARAEKYSMPSMAPALPDEEVGQDQPRRITQEIQKNRGLTPHR